MGPQGLPRDPMGSYGLPWHLRVYNEIPGITKGTQDLKSTENTEFTNWYQTFLGLIFEIYDNYRIYELK